MRGSKSYLAQRANWKIKDKGLICPQCELEEETFNYVFRRAQFWRIDKRLRDSGPKIKISKFTEEEVVRY